MFNTEICGHFCDNIMHFISQKVIFDSCFQTENGHHSERLLNNLIMHCVNFDTLGKKRENTGIETDSVPHLTVTTLRISMYIIVWIIVLV